MLKLPARRRQASSHNLLLLVCFYQSVVNYVKIASSHNFLYAESSIASVVNYVKIASSHNIGWYNSNNNSNILDN